MNLADLWIEYENKPLRWQYPLGILVDNLGIDISCGPITLTVRLRVIMFLLFHFFYFIKNIFYIKTKK